MKTHSFLGMKSSFSIWELIVWMEILAFLYDFMLKKITRRFFSNFGTFMYLS